MPALPSLRQVSYLLALDRHRHFGHAADSCFVTQSTLSAGLQELEAMLGVTLVERTKRRVYLTPLGKVMAARGRELLRIAEEMADLARGAKEPLTGLRHLGVIPTIAPFLLPRVLPALTAAFPRLQLSVTEDLSARLLDQLGTGQLDAVVLALPYAADAIETLDLAADPFLLTCPADHPLARRPSIEPEDLPLDELILLQDGHCLTDHALSACRLPVARGGRRRAGMQGTSLHTVVQMVAGGLGITLLPRLAIDSGILRGTGLIARPLTGAASRMLALAWRQSSPHAAEFALLGARIAAACPAPL